MQKFVVELDDVIGDVHFGYEPGSPSGHRPATSLPPLGRGAFGDQFNVSRIGDAERHAVQVPPVAPVPGEYVIETTETARVDHV